jgi:hypothetical protein
LKNTGTNIATPVRRSFNLQTELPMWSNPFAFIRPGLEVYYLQ